MRMGTVVWFLISRMELWLVAAIAYFCGCFNGAVIILNTSCETMFAGMAAAMQD